MLIVEFQFYVRILSASLLMLYDGLRPKIVLHCINFNRRCGAREFATKRWSTGECYIVQNVILIYQSIYDFFDDNIIPTSRATRIQRYICMSEENENITTFFKQQQKKNNDVQQIIRRCCYHMIIFLVYGYTLNIELYSILSLVSLLFVSAIKFINNKYRFNIVLRRFIIENW